MRIITLTSMRGQPIDVIVDKISTWTTNVTAFPQYSVIRLSCGAYVEVTETREQITELLLKAGV